MSTIVAGDTWTVTSAEGLGTGIGAIPAAAAVMISAVLPPFSPGVAQVDENTVVANYVFQDWVYDSSGNLAEAGNTRTLAYPESVFLELFTAPVGAA